MWNTWMMPIPIALGFLQDPGAIAERADAPSTDPSRQVIEAARRHVARNVDGEAQARAFDELLAAARADSSGRAALAAPERPVLEHLLQALADREQHQDRWTSLRERYFAPPGDARPAKVARQLAPSDATADNRLAWEYLLLAPGPGMPLSDQRAIEALGWIADEASLPVLEFAYQATCGTGLPIRDVVGKQTWLLESMARMASEAALAAITAALVQSEEQKAGQPRDPTYDAEQAVGNLLRLWVEHDVELGRRWRKLLTTQLAIDLPARQAAVLDRLRTAIG